MVHVNREQLEHVIRAASAITNQYEIVVVGSQSILGAYPQAPAPLLFSMEADVFPLRHPELADLIDGAIGEASAFHDQFGYYAQGVGPETAVLPKGWQERLVPIQNPNTDLRIGYCLEPHDLAVSKMLAGRPKDWPYVEAMLEHGLVQLSLLHQRLASTAASQAAVAKAQAFLNSKA